MSKSWIYIFLIFVFTTGSVYGQKDNAFESRLSVKDLIDAPAMLIPFPKDIEWDKEYLEIKSARIGNVPSQVARDLNIVGELNSILASHNIDVDERSGLPIYFIRSKTIEKEGYHLIISKEKIEVKALNDAGYYYALQSLRQLIQTNSGTTTLPICQIKDSPAFPIRGYMIDVGRNFQSIASLKKQLDIMARYKLNTFQWHLTDRPAWRIESKMYPELTAAENHRPTRNPGKYYTYDEIRDLIQYARERNIQIIPEIDMPGHSDSFVKSMGVKMESEKGMEILENILNEFFKEIPLADCPVIHIGSDEVRIDNPDEFISKMVGVCKMNNREVMMWNPGLNADSTIIRQTWKTEHVEKGAFREIDSWNSYVNNGEPMTQIQRLFFKPIGYPSDNNVIGGILCFWPDVNLEKEADAFEQNPVYSSMLTYAWKTWTADITHASEEYYMTLPPKGSTAFNYFSAFENILVHHKKQYFKNEPFQYITQVDKNWRIIGPFNNDDGDGLLENIKNSYSYNGKRISWQSAIGNTLVVKDRFKLGGYYPNAQKGQTVYALTYIHSDDSRIVDTWIGFETPMRANRTYTGIPAQGEWDVSGGNVWINDKALTPPIWKNPGWRSAKSEGWGPPEEREMAWGQEELYWTRTPTKVSLKKGWNKVLAKIPSSSNYQNWMFTFVPLEMEGLIYSEKPQSHSMYYYQRKSHFENLPNDKREVIFVGDSIIDGCEWSEMFGNKRIKNRGISGDGSQGVLDRLDEITDSNPQKIFLMIGVNDLARGIPTKTIIENIRQIVVEINVASPKTEVYVQSILPVNDYYDKFTGHTSKFNEIVAINQALASEGDGAYEFIDLHSSFINTEGKLDVTLSNDGLHLNHKGYERWASLIKNLLK